MGNLRRQLFWLLIFRLVVFTTLLGSIIFLQALDPRAGWSLYPFFHLLVAAFAFSALYFLLYRLRANDRANAYLQFLGDVVLVGGFLYYTGGLFSPFAILYFVVVIVAGTLLYRQGAFIVASLAFISYGVIVVMTYRRMVPAPLDPELEKRYFELSAQDAYYWLFLYMFGLYAVAWLTSRLSEGVRRERSSAERSAFRVRELEAFHQTLVESMTVGLLTTDEKGRIGFASGSVETILGRPAPEIVGRHIDEELLGEGGFETVQRELATSLKHRLEVPWAHADGLSLHLGVTASRLGAPVEGTLVLVEDLTDLKELEEEVRLKDRMAALGEMAAGLAHEIRNPLASMTGSVEVLNRDLKLEGDHARLADIVMRESKRLDGIIRDFLDYARPRPLEVKEIDLTEVTRETVDLFRHSTDEGRIELAVDCGEAVFCRGDANQLRQVVWNLLRNSKEAMPEGGRLWVEVRRVGDNARLRVGDTGTGMTEEERQRAVQPFRGSPGKGVGLGLTIVYRIIRDHDGSISIQSSKGVGTEVTVLIPCQRGPAREPAPEVRGAAV